jgi:hypothetical protein
MNSVTTNVSQCKIQTLLSLATNGSTGKALFVTHSVSKSACNGLLLGLLPLSLIDYYSGSSDSDTAGKPKRKLCE